MIPMKGYSTQAVDSAAKPFQILFSLCHFSFTFSETSIREHFSPLPPGRSRSSLALRKLSNTKSVLDSFGPFDFVTKTKEGFIPDRMGTSESK